ncbi:MAG: nuclear transport factor 2 family protein [Proteobacteria bacterium]|nr:nuclear transport factor 2 family protein [Pseudomonadota bacterium]
MLTPADRIAIHELLALYGHVIDERAWERVCELFTERSIYDMRDFGLGVVHGAAAIRALWSDPAAPHPLAHHATNIVVSEDSDGTVRALSKGLGVGANGRVGSVVYRDVLERTAAGWRFAERIAALRRAPPAPRGS